MKKTGYRFFFFFLSFLLIGCSSSDTKTTEDAGQVGMKDTEAVPEMATQQNAEEAQLIGEKVIKTVEVNYKTTKYAETVNYISEIVAKHHAYIEYSYESTYSSGGIEAGNREYHRRQYTLRVPTAALADFLKDMEGSEAVKVSEQVGSQDITQAYRDTETRMDVLKRKEDRLNELLQQADTIDQVLQIENSLSDTIAEREQLQSQLDNYDDLIDYTAVHLSLEERQRVTSAPEDGLPFWERMKEALLNSVFVFYYWIQNLIIWLVYALPFILVIVLFVFSYLKIKNKKKMK